MTRISSVLYGLAALVLTAGVTLPAAAQEAGSAEIGGFGRYTVFDSTLGLKNKIGVGGRLGLFVIPNLAIEGDASYTSTGVSTTTLKVSYIPLHARLIYNVPVAPRVAWLLGLGYAHNQYGKDGSGSDDGVAGLVGLRFMVGQVLAVRLDGTLDYMPYKTLGASDLTHFALQTGLSALLGHHGPRDGDHDGVADDVDACPRTPPGDVVGTNGCTLPKDADHDGVVDSADRCSNTPAGDKVDATGCSLPKDSDRDGVSDAADQCPNTPAGDAVDARGCSLPKDSDHDGVLDGADRCPNTPKGAFVNSDGCTIPTDSDGDGVTDDQDRCPGTPGGDDVDAKGCTWVSIFKPGTTALVLEGVNFETGKAVLLSSSKETLDRVVAALIGNPDVQVEVAGYT
ncbi:MAG: thrombospondin type 3 repeat-containing protein, partial [Gemmatimonadales bacterium]